MTEKLKILMMWLLLLFFSEGASAFYHETITTSQPIPQKGISAVVSFQKNKGSSAPLSNNNCVKVYAKGTITITPNKYYLLSKIDFYYTVYKGTSGRPNPKFLSSEGTFNKTDYGCTWTGSTAQPVVLLVNGNTGNFLLSKVVITYDIHNDKQNTYTSFSTKKIILNLDNDNYHAFKGQQAKTSPYDLPLVYTSDNEKVATVDAQTGTVTLKHSLGTTTIKSTFAGNDTLNSSFDSYTITVYPYHDGTANHPYSVADIYALKDANMYIKEGDSIYVNGYITNIKKLERGKMTYYISDDLSAKKELLIDANYNLNKTDFENINDLSIGWFVTIKGRNRIVNFVPQILGGYITKIIKNNVESPHISGPTAFLYNTLVTLSTENQNAKIYYTTDGSEPSDQSIAYVTPFSLYTSATVKAISCVNGEKSEVVSQAFKKVEENELVTVADALHATDGTTVYVKGTVVKTETYDNKFPYLNYYIGNEEDGTDELEIRRGHYLQNADVNNAFQIVRGDEVAVAAQIATDNGVKVLADAQLMRLDECQDKAIVGSPGWATFVSRRAVDFSQMADIQAYSVKYNDDFNNVTLSPVTAIPGNTAVVVKANAGTYVLPRGNEKGTVTDNDLTFDTAEKKVETAYTVYVLSKQGNGCGFYPVKVNETIAPYKGYLTIHHSAKKKSKRFYAIVSPFTPISFPLMKWKKPDHIYYNLAGQRINKHYKGLAIVDGHKILIK